MEPDNRPLHVRTAEALGFKTRNAKAPDGPDVWMLQCARHRPPNPGESPNEWRAVPRYDTDWAATGPFIERFGIDVTQVGVPVKEYGWHAEVFGEGLGGGATPLVAICNLLLVLHAAGKLER